MDAITINKMYAEILDNQKACQELKQKQDELWQSWEQRVIAIGNALSSAKQQHGKGWKRDFSSFGFDFSFTFANRYIACAVHPELGSTNDTIEEWAKASAELDRTANESLAAREARRQQRAARRSLQAQSIESEDSAEAVELSEDQTVSDVPVDEHSQLAFEFLDRAIQQSAKYIELREHWLTHLQALSNGIVPRTIMVSSIVSDDTVDLGGTHPEPEADELLDGMENSEATCVECVCV